MLPYIIFFGIVIIVGRGIMLLLQLRQGISSGYHHATPTPVFFGIVIIAGREHYASASTAKLFLQDATTLQLHPFFGVELSLLWEGAL